MLKPKVGTEKLDLGGRLRALRNLHRLTQRELADRTGISVVTVSQIENDRTSPSVGLLKKLLDGVPISLSAFFAGDFTPDDEIFFEPHQLTEIGTSLISLRQVGGSLKDRKIQMLLEVHGRSADSGDAMLSHEGEEAGVVIRGRLEITVAGRTAVLKPGGAYYFDSRLPHRFRNVGKEDCVVVSACTPPTF
jgi:transcriptional regulator with XRE-family HTH domain